MLSFGPYFYPTGLKNEITITIPIIKEVLNEHGIDGILSSGIDRKHSAKSLHYPGLALDITWAGFDEHEWHFKQSVRDQLAKRLGEHYDVVLSQGCIHVEYQPKVAVNEHWRDHQWSS